MPATPCPAARNRRCVRRRSPASPVEADVDRGSPSESGPATRRTGRATAGATPIECHDSDRRDARSSGRRDRRLPRIRDQPSDVRPAIDNGCTMIDNRPPTDGSFVVRGLHLWLGIQMGIDRRIRDEGRAGGASAGTASPGRPCMDDLNSTRAGESMVCHATAAQRCRTSPRSRHRKLRIRIAYEHRDHRPAPTAETTAAIPATRSHVPVRVVRHRSDRPPFRRMRWPDDRWRACARNARPGRPVGSTESAARPIVFVGHLGSATIGSRPVVDNHED